MRFVDGSIMMSIVDITKKVLLDKESERSNLLSIINATVSHDMRNPLNSIIAMNLKNKKLYLQLIDLVESN